MSSLDKQELEIMGYSQVYDYTQFCHDNHVNVIPEESFKKLVSDTFKTIADVLRKTYGPYGSNVIISEQNETVTTKDGYNVFESMGFSHQYKRMVYLAIQKIIERVNRNVGDGTTSCILLAEKMFDKINDIVKTPEDNRRILTIFNSIEKDLQDALIIDEDKKSLVIKDLSDEALWNLIDLSGNYDTELTEVIYKSLDPKLYNMKGKDIVKSVRNVIVESEIDYEGESNVRYDIDYLPGDYRVRINMDVEMGLALNEETKVKVVLYDHAFGPTDWNNFMNGYDKETKVLVVARTFTKTFMDNEYVRYLKERAYTKTPVNIILSSIEDSHFQDEIKDLGAILNTKVNDLHAGVIKHEELPEATIRVYKGNALCFYDVKPPIEYIEKLEKEMDKDLSHSYIKRKSYLNRINALSLSSKDTLVTVKAGTSLELKMITDKIDDCVSIVNSALETGIVPNMFVYAYKRLKPRDYPDDYKSLLSLTKSAICDSIKGLFADIWESKYGDESTCSVMFDSKCETLYDVNEENKSYDIMNDQFVEVEHLPTSAQYDLEVVVAAISIVKYLITSKAFVFDAHLMTPVGDQGRYQKF